MSRATGISHLGIRTLDLDRFLGFYEDLVAIDVLLRFDHGDQPVAIIGVGEHDTLVVFEGGPDDARPDGRGIDHLGFTLPDEVALQATRDRLVAMGASDGTVRQEGPLLAVDFVDPDGTRGEINCLAPGFEPSAIPGDAVHNPAWYERTRRIMTAAP